VVHIDQYLRSDRLQLIWMPMAVNGLASAVPLRDTLRIAGMRPKRFLSRPSVNVHTGQPMCAAQSKGVGGDSLTGRRGALLTINRPKYPTHVYEQLDFLNKRSLVELP
jgi:hypothetical protein